MPVERPPWLDCHACQLHFHRNRDPLMAACATVGIEHGVDRHSVLRSWLDGYHADGHVEPEPTRVVAVPTDPEDQT